MNGVTKAVPLFGDSKQLPSAGGWLVFTVIEAVPLAPFCRRVTVRVNVYVVPGYHKRSNI